MGLAKINVTKEWLLIGNNVSSITFQNITQNPVYVTATSTNTPPANNDYGIVFELYQGYRGPIPDNGNKFIWVKSISKPGSIVVGNTINDLFSGAMGAMPWEPNPVGGGGGSTVDRELVVSTYRVRTAFTGTSVGDTITSTQIIDVSGTPTTVSTIWRNQTTAADLASAPSAGNLELVGSQALTDAQLRASAVAISATTLPLPTGASTETTLAALNTKIPAQAISGLLPVDTLGTPGVPRVQATSATAANIILTTSCRRVSMFATQGAWYSLSGAATATSHYIGTSERLDFDVPASTTISVLQETTAGSIRITELT